MPRACVIIAPGAEEMETITVADLLVRAECEVVLAAADTLTAMGSRGIPLTAHTTLDEVHQDAFDLVYLPGGLGSAEWCSKDQRIQDMVESRIAAEELTALICACPLMLRTRQIAAGVKLTSYPGTKDDMLAAGYDWVDTDIVDAGCLVTSQGPGTAMGLGLHLIQRLFDDDKANAVAAAALVRRNTWTVEIV